MDWFALAPSVLTAIAILLVPGALLSLAVGVRGVLVVVVASPLSITLIGGLAVVLDRFAIRWSPVSYALSAAAVTLLAWVLWLIVNRFTKVSLRVDVIRLPGLVIGLMIALVGIYFAMITFFGSPLAFAQTFDNVFHLNVIRYIGQTGHASSFAVSALTSGGSPPPFYPAAWHAYVALVVSLTGLTIGAAVNAATIAAVGFGWALGCLALAQVMAGPSALVSVVAGTVVGATYIFPWAFLWSGGLYPNLLGNSLIPGCLAVLMLLAGPTRTFGAAGKPGQRYSPSAVDEPPRPRLVGSHPQILAWLLIVAALPGVGLAHPNAAFTLALAMLATAAAALVKAAVAASSWLHRGVLIGVGLLWAAGVAGFVVAWIRFAPSSPNAPTILPDQWTALWLLIAGGGVPLSAPVPNPALTVFIGLGLIGAVLRRNVTALVLSFVASGVFVLAFGSGDPVVAGLAGGIFYGDIQRVAAFALICSMPLLMAGIGLSYDVLRWLTVWIRRPRLLAPTVRGLAVVGIAVAVANPVQYMVPLVQAAAIRFVIPSDFARFFNADEYSLMTRMPRLVPSGDRVITDPGTGGAFIYSISGTEVVYPHIFVTDSAAANQLRNHLFDPTQLAATCAAVKQLNAHYFYTSTRGHPANFTGKAYYPGLAHPRKSMLKVVARSGTGWLYRFTACDRL